MIADEPLVAQGEAHLESRLVEYVGDHLFDEGRQVLRQFVIESFRVPRADDRDDGFGIGVFVEVDRPDDLRRCWPGVCPVVVGRVVFGLL